MSVHFGIFKSIVDRASIPIFLVEPVTVSGKEDFVIRYVNAEWERWTGFHASTMVDIPFCCSPCCDSEWPDIIADVYTSGKNRVCSFYSDSYKRWYNIDFSLIQAGDSAEDGAESRAFGSADSMVFGCLYEVGDNSVHEKQLEVLNLKLSSLSKELDLSHESMKSHDENIASLNRELEYLSHFDAFTNLPNKKRFMHLLREQIQISSERKTMLGVMFIDIDNLKNINESEGHSAGDAVIIQMASRLQQFERNRVIPSRFGGDEFLLIIPNLETEARMINISDAILEALAQPYKIGNREMKASVSAGIALYPHDAQNAEELLKYADIAMHEVKNQGKNSTAFFHYIMQDKLLDRMNIESKLAHAMDDQVLKLYFQPQMDMHCEKIRGFEALLRWHDAGLGWISPERFIPVAEESRIIIPLGQWVLRRACTVLREWQQQFGFDGIMSVNVSPVQLKKDTFVEDLRRIIQETGIHPESLEIEITEGVLIDNIEQSIQILREIKDMGVGISLDDFGTGYASLSYLQMLPLTTLKIDKTFIANIAAENSLECEITSAIITLVTKMGLSTIAEGVETEEQLAILRSIRCDYLQGFLIGRPMPVDECIKVLEANMADAGTRLL
ncbi:MAG: bifunctional diguanylate cyclase/phosphodiesterase [Spirochaetaceae bacterium]|jgi:diguanylate cyclase (GGDEF)-like protein|nr:bifunctional diguanylate cyclase/phosphodiesterase [Spirochaetaceae bacterium]